MADTHDTLIRSEFSRQADTIAQGAVFNDAAILERIRQAAQLDKRSRTRGPLKVMMSELRNAA